MASKDRAVRSVVVTGASGGTGTVTALRLAGCGFEVIGTVRFARRASSPAPGPVTSAVTGRTALAATGAVCEDAESSTRSRSRGTIG